MTESPALASYKAQVASEAQEAIHIILPQKLGELSELLETKYNLQHTNEFFTEQYAKCNLNNPYEEYYFLSKVQDDDGSIDKAGEDPDVDGSEDEDFDGLNDSLEETRIDAPTDVCVGDSPKVTGDLPTSIGAKNNGGSKESHALAIIKKPQIKTVIKINSELMQLAEDLKDYIEDLIEHIKVVKEWIQFMIPTIEDGNTFGVEVQERIKKEVNYVINAFNEYQRQTFNYNDLRGRYGIRIVRYPENIAFKRAIIELDQNHYSRLRLTIKDMRSRIAHMLDIITKNWSKITHPRSNNCESIY